MNLTAYQLEALPVGSRVRAGTSGPGIVYQKTDPPGPNGPWRRPFAEGPNEGKWVTTSSSVLATIGVVMA